MSGNIHEIYTVQNSQFSTTESLRAISRAKEEALRSKEAKLVYLNGMPVYKVDRKGTLIAA
jgi:hypothetical protein